MALIPIVLQQQLITNFTSVGIVGISMPGLATALSLGITTHLITGQVLGAVDSGIAGVGVGNGKLLGINPGLLTPALIGQMSAVGILGSFAAPMANAISLAFSSWFNALNQVITIDAGVGVGIGTAGKVINLIPPVMEGLILTQMVAVGIKGTGSLQLAKAVANAIVLHVSSIGFSIVAITGAIIPPIPPTPTVASNSIGFLI